jgi:NhaP-type Na+/H+ or K+/H+ antiporter
MVVVGYIGAVLFGLLIGWVTARLLSRRGGSAHVSHIAAVIAAVGGGYVAVKSHNLGVFGLYAIALVVGFAGYAAAIQHRHKDAKKTAAVLGLDETG